MNDDEIRPWVKGSVEYVGEPLENIYKTSANLATTTVYIAAT
jgi:hypothetical protein